MVLPRILSSVAAPLMVRVETPDKAFALFKASVPVEETVAVAAPKLLAPFSVMVPEPPKVGVRL